VGTEKPLIFDFVNNFANIRHRDMLNEFNRELEQFKELFLKEGIPYPEISFEIVDRVQDLKVLLDEVERVADSWNVFFDRLEKYRSEHGDCNVPSTYPDKWLGHKVTATRQRYKQGTLSPEVIERLNKMGFVWNTYEETWEKFFELLEKYREKHGDYNVPSTYPDLWLVQKVSNTRQRYKQGTLLPEVIARLNQMGFVWNTYEESWNVFFELLEKYRAEHGDCNVPLSYPDKWLATKVSKTRKSYKKGVLPPEVINRLNSMGFVWVLRKKR
jgi:hypothetical protein